MKALLPGALKRELAPTLPAELDVRWFQTDEDAIGAMPEADIAWVDLANADRWRAAVAAGARLQWLMSAYAGLDSLDLELLARRGTRVTNGSGLAAHAVAEYAVLGALVAAKRFDQVMRAAVAQEWLWESPGKTEFSGTAALIIGFGTIGRLIGERLRAFGIEVTGVTRSGDAGTLRPDEWRMQLHRFDWIFLAAPSTGSTHTMIGATELAAMRRNAWIINVGRGDLIDQQALVDATTAQLIGGAFLDTTDPEPLPSDHPLWHVPSIILSMHLSGRSQSGAAARAVALFSQNLSAFLTGESLLNEVDLDSGY